MAEIIYLLNYISVGIFGMVLSASFCNIQWTKKKYFRMSLIMAAILAVQGIIYFLADSQTVRYIYPLITHIPLMVVLCIFCQNIFEGINSVLVAYLCCQLRRWIALLAVYASTEKEMHQNIVELIITVPLLFVLIKFASKAVRVISKCSFLMKVQFAIIPILYYFFDYFAHIYTGLLSKGTPVVVEFMPFVCSIAYLVFVFCITQEMWARNQLEKKQDILNLQVTQAIKEIENLRENQQNAIAYRHDLRHHMQFLSDCIENMHLEQAKSYINEICACVEASKMIVYCNNEAANLILSAYVKRAKQYDINIKVEVSLSHDIAISESDLCVLLSNALENAISSCKKLRELGKSAEIEIIAYEKKDKIFLQISNSCDLDISFDNGIPVTKTLGHGIGVKSICAIVEHYKGLYTFSVKDNHFILRVSI